MEYIKVVGKYKSLKVRMYVILCAMRREKKSIVIMFDISIHKS